MTIKEYVLNQPNMGINEWLGIIESDAMNRHTRLILECANHFDKIIINHNASFNVALFN